jgi:hypothetical protein
MLTSPGIVDASSRVLACCAVLILAAACGSAASSTADSGAISRDTASYGSFGSDPCELRSPMRISVDRRVMADGKHLNENAQISASRGNTLDVDVALVNDHVNLDELLVYVTENVDGLAFPVPREKVNASSDGSSAASDGSRSARVRLKDRGGRDLEPGSYRLVMEAIVSGDSEACAGTQATQAVVYPLTVRPAA